MADQLKSSTVVRAAQRPATTFWVPLDVFLVECLVAFALFRFLNLWALVFVPLHAIPVMLTTNDLFWVTKLRLDFWHYVAVGNRDLRSRRGVTFSPERIRTKANSDEFGK